MFALNPQSREHEPSDSSVRISGSASMQAFFSGLHGLKTIFKLREAGQVGSETL